MSEIRYKTFDGQDVTENEDLFLTMPGDSPVSYEVNVSYRERRGRRPRREGVTFPEIRHPFRAFRRLSVPHDEAMELLDVHAGERELVIEYDNGGGAIDLRGQAEVVRVSRDQRGGAGVYNGEFAVREPWSAVTESTASSSPFTVGGNVFTLPTITLTPSGTTVAVRTLTATDNTGRGLANHPIRFEFDSTGVGADGPENYVVFYGGRAVPFALFEPDNASTVVWLRMNLGPDASTRAVIYYGSDVDESYANTFQSGGMDLENSTNTVWRWNDWEVRSFPVANGVWRPGIFSPVHDHSDIHEESSTSVLTRSRADQSPDDLINGAQVNALVLATGVAADDDDALENLRRIYRRLDNDGTLNFQVAYQRPSRTAWERAWLVNTSSNMFTLDDSDLDVDGATAIAVAIRRNEEHDAELEVGDFAHGGGGTAANDSSHSGDSWSTTGNALTDSLTAATSSVTSNENTQYLKITNFGFAVPAGAEIQGIRLMVRHSAAASDRIVDDRVRIVKADGSIGTEDKADPSTFWPSQSVQQVVSYGGRDDLWGESWTPADINHSNFGFVIAANNTGVGTTARVHYATITVYYTGGDDMTSLTLDSDEVPDTDVSAAATAHVLDDDLVVTHPGDSTTTIALDRLYLPDEDLVIDCLEQSVEVDNDGEMHTTGEAVQFHDGERWMSLSPGSHSYTDPANASSAWSWRNRFIL